MVLPLPTPDQSAAQALAEARMSVLKLSGMDRYRSREGYNPETQEGREKIAIEISDELEAESELAHARNKFGWSDEQYEGFLSITDRRPFKSSIVFDGDPKEKQKQLSAIGAMLNLEYQMTSDPAAKVKAGETLARFLQKSVEVLFYPKLFDWTDEYNGVDTQKRRSGDIGIDPATGQSKALTVEMANFIQGVVGQVAQARGADAGDLYKQVLDATRGGNFALIESFLQGTRIDKTVREVLEQIVVQRAQDQSLAIKKLKLVWEVEKYRLAMGIDLNTYYAINNFQSPDNIKQILEGKLDEVAPAEALRAAIESEVSAYNQLFPDNPISFENGKINYGDIFKAYTEGRLQLPDHAESEVELAAKIARVHNRLVSAVSVLATDSESLRNYFEAPSRMGATHRPFNSKYKNEAGQEVNIQHLNPTFPEGLLMSVMAHEDAHKLHDFMLALALNNGLLTNLQRETVPNLVYELFAVLVENQAPQVVAAAAPAPAQAEVKESPKIDPARNFSPRVLLARRQLSFALCQSKTREVLEQRWNNSQREDLSDQEAEEILKQLQTDLDRWYTNKALTIVNGPRNFVSNNIDPVLGFDGAIYIPDIKAATSREQGEAEVDVDQLNRAFVERFVENWLGTKEGQLALLGLLVRSGIEHNAEGYPEYVRNANLDELKQSFSTWSLPENFRATLE